MRGRAFDLALQMHGGGRYSNPFLLRLGARVTAGSQTPDAAPLHRSMPHPYYHHEVLRYLELVGLVGAGPGRLQPTLAVTAADLDAARTVAPSPEPLVVLHPGAGDARRRWPVDRFAAVGDALAERGMRVVVTGDAGEAELTAAVTRAMRRPGEDAGGRLSLLGLVGLLSRARIIVSNDSGPLHVARAVGTATVGIYWCANMLTAGPVRATGHVVAMSWRLACPVCGVDATRGSCAHDASFVADVPPGEVLAGVDEALASSERP